MKDDAIFEQMNELLPELYGGKRPAPRSGGLCAPGSGCGPAPERAGTDILKILADSLTAPPDDDVTPQNPEADTKAKE